jgi:hypothetical protein
LVRAIARSLTPSIVVLRASIDAPRRGARRVIVAADARAASGDGDARRAADGRRRSIYREKVAPA